METYCNCTCELQPKPLNTKKIPTIGFSVYLGNKETKMESLPAAFASNVYLIHN